ncbi:MAG: PD-(D/E)XK nuclease family protein [Candidatus Pacearchaeota archaeon]
MKTWRSNFKGIRWTDSEGNTLHGAIDNLLVNGKKLVVLDYKTRGFALKEDTHRHYQHQLDIYNFLLRKNGYETEDFGFLLFYIPDKVLETGEVIFNKKLVRMEANVHHAEKLFKDAIKLLNGNCPKKDCGWCQGFNSHI